jgi:hypothetical protein
MPKIVTGPIRFKGICKKKLYSLHMFYIFDILGLFQSPVEGRGTPTL